jgi:hypothetical protein
MEKVFLLDHIYYSMLNVSIDLVMVNHMLDQIHLINLKVNPIFINLIKYIPYTNLTILPSFSLFTNLPIIIIILIPSGLIINFVILFNHFLLPFY